jgi:hypothetical protein
MALTWSMFFFVAWALSYISSMFTLSYMATVFFITLVCPYWLIRIQKYKKYVSCALLLENDFNILVQFMAHGTKPCLQAALCYSKDSYL